MTNAEKYLKDGVEQRYFATELYKFVKDIKEPNLLSMINTFLSLPTKPILSEDEKVILRNTNKKYEFIGRKNEFVYIRIFLEDNEYFASKISGIEYMFPNLFQFIKERRRI